MAMCNERLASIKLIESIILKWPNMPNDKINNLSDDKRTQIVKLIERGCHNTAIDIADNEGYEKVFGNSIFTKTYSALVYKLVSNIDYLDQNRPLINMIIDDEIDILSLANMTSEELCPSANKKIRDEIQLRQKQRIVKNVSTLYTCPRCKGNRTVLQIQQTRALDEGTTLAIKCDNCEHEWKKY